MKLLLISIKDRAVEAFQPVGNVRSLGEALRVFHDLLANQQSPQAQHPEDYDLYLVGQFDDQTGSISDDHEGDQTDNSPLPRKIADGKTVAEMLSAKN